MRHLCYQAVRRRGRFSRWSGPGIEGTRPRAGLCDPSHRRCEVGRVTAHLEYSLGLTGLYRCKASRPIRGQSFFLFGPNPVSGGGPFFCARILSLCLLASVQSLTCFGQSSQEIVTDRPDITESSIVVPPGTLQSENGVTWTGDHGKRTVDLSESLLRLGVWSRSEFRIELPNYIGGFGGRANPSGLTDSSAGVKYQIGPLPGAVDLAVIAGVSFPTGSRSISSHGFDPFLKFPWSRELKAGWSVGVQSLFLNTDSGHRNAIWEPEFYLEREVTKHSDAFLEYAADYPRSGDARQLIHLGAAYRFTQKQQIDVHFGFGLTNSTPRHFFAAGYSFRIDRLFGLFRK
jgi:hypothetical protein